MARIPELQELLENAERMCNAVDDAARRRHTTFGLLRVGLCLFLAHLCKADFHLADEEAAFIADNLDISFTTEEMNRYIRTHHTEHPDFAKKIPTSFSRLVAYDRTQAAAEPSHLSRRSLGEGGAAAYYIAVFQHFGDALISADGSRSLSEIAAYSDYFNALRTYQVAQEEK